MNRTIRMNNNQRWILAGLLVLCLVPVAGGLVRMTQLISGAAITPENARFFAAPVPVLVHIVALIPYSIIGAMQFIPGIRRRSPRWHRRLGWVLAPAGIMVALSGLWMTFFYPLPASDGEALRYMRLVVGLAILYTIGRGLMMMYRRDYKTHGAWMLRAYALAMGAGTQVFTALPWLLLYGIDTPIDASSKAIMMAAGWLINLLLAEWIIRRRWIRTTQRTPVVASPHDLAREHV